jgi:hypothetical protein
MRRLLIIAFALASCGDDRVPTPRSWPEAWQAVVAVCSPYCRWRVRCAGDVLETCETACEAAACASVDCSLPPSGTDETIAACSHDIYIEAVSAEACAAEPAAYTETCRAAAVP